jgi:hypothetical protein
LGTAKRHRDQKSEENPLIFNELGLSSSRLWVDATPPSKITKIFPLYANNPERKPSLSGALEKSISVLP